MSDKINLLKSAVSLEESPEFDAYSKVEVTISTDTSEKQVVTVGTDIGRTLEIEMLQCTDTEQARLAAQRILTNLRGFQYKPFAATECLVNPATEIGDGIAINGVYSGVYNTEYNLGSMITASLTAPQDEAIEHEYSTATSTNRVLTREMDKAYSKLSITSQAITAEVSRATAAEGTLLSAIELNAENITAKVSKSGGGSSFSWELTDSSWTVQNGSTTVFSVTSEGATVKGVITATSGKIGGFNIGSRGLYHTLSSYGGSSDSGVYIGTDGIQLGQKFKVSTSGKIEADSAVLTGTLTVGGSSITASNLKSGADNGNRVGGGMSGSGTKADTFSCNYLSCDHLTADTLAVSGASLTMTGDIDLGGKGNVSDALSVDTKRLTVTTAAGIKSLSYGSNYQYTLKGKATITNSSGVSITVATVE